MKSIQEIVSERNPDAFLKIGELLAKNEESFEETLLKSNVLQEEEVLEVLSEFYEFPYTHRISERDIDPELIKILPISFAKKFRLLPFQRRDDSVVIIFARSLRPRRA